MKQFALIGAAGYVAPRHMKAIKDTGNDLVAAVDRFDSVGIIDRYFPNSAFFTEFERFDRHVEKMKRAGNPLDYISICSPNYLHDAHIRFGLRIGSDIICEKPLVLNPWNADALMELEQDYGHKVNCILQLRLHDQVKALKAKVDQLPDGEKHEVELTYITSRGSWYYTSWKGDESKSGGIATNIGVHFFDMLTWLYGDVEDNVVNINSHDRAAGIMNLKKANVKWFLSINDETLPQEISQSGQRIYRSLTLGDEVFDFSKGFDDLHTKSYQHILDGHGYGIADTKQAIDIVYQIRNSDTAAISEQSHPLASLPLAKHPFSS